MKNLFTFALLAVAMLLAVACQKKAVPAQNTNASPATVAPAIVPSEAGQAKVHEGDNAAAILELDKVIEENPKDADAYYWRAVAKCYIADSIGCCKDYEYAAKFGHLSAAQMLEKNCSGRK